MKALTAAIGLLLGLPAFSAPEILVKPALSENDVISVTVFGVHASHSVPYYTRLFKQGAIQNSYYPAENAIMKLEQFLPCVLDGIEYRACAAHVQARTFERLSASTTNLLHSCALRMREFDMIDFKIAPEGGRVVEIRLPDSCQVLVP